jgi:putative membrane protein
MSKKILNIVSIVIPLVVAILLGLPQKLELGIWTKQLPMVNAVINSISAVVLILALVAIKGGKVIVHRKLMLSAVFLGLLFLINYILYHVSNSETKYGLC